jgi:hypothetical protein
MNGKQVILELRLDSFPGKPLDPAYVSGFFHMLGLEDSPEGTPVFSNSTSTYWLIPLEKEPLLRQETGLLAYMEELYGNGHIMDYGWNLLEPAEGARRGYELAAMKETYRYHSL